MGPNPIWVALLLKREIQTQTQTFREGRWWENGNLTIEAETGMMLLYVKSTKDCQDCPGQEGSHLGSQKECGPANIFTLDY